MRILGNGRDLGCRRDIDSIRDVGGIGDVGGDRDGFSRDLGSHIRAGSSKIQLVEARA